jgi:hypothetical protein
MAKSFEGIVIIFLVRILIIVTVIILLLSVWGCVSNDVPKNLISNGSFEEDFEGLSIRHNANIKLVNGYPQLFFLKNFFFDKNSKIRLFPASVSPENLITISGSIEIVNPIPKVITTYFDTINFPSRRFIPLPHYRTYTLKTSLTLNSLPNKASRKENFDEISLERIIPDKIFKILSMPIIKPLISLLSTRILVKLVSNHGDVKIFSDDPNLLTSIDFKDEWRDYRNVAKQDWTYTKKIDYLPLQGNQSLMVDSWKTSHITRKISGLEPGKEYLLMTGRRNILGKVSPSVQILEESGRILEKSILPILLHEGWVRSLILFKPQQKNVLIQLGGGSKILYPSFRFVNLYDDVHLYKIPEEDIEKFYRYLHSNFNISLDDISIGFKVVDYKKIIPKKIHKAYYKEHKTLGIPILDLFYDPAAFWRKQMEGYSLALKMDPYAIAYPRKLKHLFPAQLRVDKKKTIPPRKLKQLLLAIDKKNTIPVGFKFRGVHSTHYAGRNKSIKISRTKKNRMYLLNPQTRNWLSEPFSYFVSRQLGGIGMRSDFVFLRMNGKHKGVTWRYWKDHTDLEFNRRPDGALLENLNSKYSLIRKNDDWKTVVRPQNVLIRERYSAKKVIVLFTTLLKKGLLEYIDGLANIEKFLTWHAHTLIVDSAHQDSTHNSFFYLNSADGRLEPVPIDVNMGRYSTIDREDNVKHFNPIIDKLLANFEFFNQRDRILWKYISDTKKIRGALEYYDNLYKKNVNAFTKTHPISIVNDAPFSDQAIQTLLLRGKEVFLARIGKLSRLISENNKIRINITQSRLAGNSKSNARQFFEIKVNPKKNSAWSSTLLESLEIKIDDVNGKIKIFPENISVRSKKGIIFPLKKFIPSDKYFIYQVYFLWEEEYLAVLEKLKNFPEKLEIVKESYVKSDDRGYSIALEVLKNENLVDSLTLIFSSIGKINVNKEKNFLVQYEGVSPIDPLKDFTFTVKNGVTLNSITPEILVSSKYDIDNGNLKFFKKKIIPESINNNLKPLSEILQRQSVYKKYAEIYSSIDVVLESYPAFIKGKLKNTILLKTGVYKFSETIILPKGIELIIEPGAELQFNTGVSLVSYGKISALGTKDNPIIFHGKNYTTKWGVIGLLHEQSGGIFENCIFDGGGEAFINGVYFSGMLAAHYTNIEVRNSILQKAGIGGGDDAINIKHGKAFISDSFFFKNYRDAIDLDYAKIGSEVRNSYFLENGNNGIDISGSNVLLQNLLVSQSKNIGVSLGEKTEAVIKNIKIERSKIALASKNSSKVKLSGGFIENNLIGVTAYRNKTLYKGGMIDIANTLFEKNKFDLGVHVCPRIGKSINKDCLSEIYIKNSKYKTHNHIIETNIRNSSKKNTSKKEIAVSFMKNSSNNYYKYVKLSDTDIKKESPSISLEPLIKKNNQENLLEKDQDEKGKISLSQNKPFSFSTQKLINFSASAWEKLNFWYLVKRELDLSLDTAWHYSNNTQNTLLQRRFNVSLEDTDTIDITFHDGIPIEDFEKLLSDFRISNSHKDFKILSIEGNLIIKDDYKRNRIPKTQRNIYIRFDIGDVIRYTYKNGETAFLKEIIILLPKSLTEVSRIRPVKSIRFMKRRSNQDFSKTDFPRRLKEKLTRRSFGQQKIITQSNRIPLDIEHLNDKLPKYTSRIR